MEDIKQIVKSIPGLGSAVSSLKWRERRVSYGPENPDRTFYVIRRHAEHGGLFSFVSTNLGAVEEAVSKGYTPVIDMMNSPNPMLRPDEVGRVNAWEDYFLQPCGFSLQDIARSKHVILGSIEPPARFPDYDMMEDPAELAGWQQSAHRYLKLQPALKQQADRWYADTFGGSRVLGVLCRGTDYVQKKPYRHPVQPDTESVIEKCREVMAAQKCESVYLATEDEEIWERFGEAFGDIVHSFQKHRFRTQQGQNINDVGNGILGPRERNTEYLISVAVLSDCTCLTAGAASGTYGALLLTKGYEYQYVFCLGRYL
ncbi:MAG: hypothetical protein LKJ76_00790 [Lachnospiraceae bacterium]|jgi:hypothetical protein|nr:hypothetical protein [Lachnospiraceae bacterium]